MIAPFSGSQCDRTKEGNNRNIYCFISKVKILVSRPIPLQFSKFCLLPTFTVWSTFELKISFLPCPMTSSAKSSIYAFTINPAVTNHECTNMLSKWWFITHNHWQKWQLPLQNQWSITLHHWKTPLWSNFEKWFLSMA